MIRVGDKLAAKKALMAKKTTLSVGDRGYYQQILKSLAIGEVYEIPESEADTVSKAMYLLKGRHRYKRKKIKEKGTVGITRVA